MGAAGIVGRADEARRRSFRVLACRLSETESALPFAGLIDLFAEVVVDEIELPEPQRQALDVALLRAAGDAPVDRLTLDVAVVSALRAVSETVPTVVAVDDLQWLDAPTARVLEFAFRRLDDVPV